MSTGEAWQGWEAKESPELFGVKKSSDPLDPRAFERANMELRNEEKVKEILGSATEEYGIQRILERMNEDGDLKEDVVEHSFRGASLAVDIGLELRLKSEELEGLALGMMLHDIGKRDMPKEILFKKGKLTDEERSVIEAHPVWGLIALSSDPELRFAASVKGVREIVFGHHGFRKKHPYPIDILGEWSSMGGGNMSEEQIRLIQLAATADVFDALASARSYKEAIGDREEAEKRMREDLNVPSEFIDMALARFEAKPALYNRAAA
ncbi:HD domain-containing protein [Candidatus Parcubacteria bacterium]|nr:MAG: HD domain-containing protein [Candidatus Parcubacteria bacterium]